MNKRLFNRAHRRMVRQTFSPGFTPLHRARKGYHYLLRDGVVEWGDSHGRRGRKPLSERSRYELHLRCLS